MRTQLIKSFSLLATLIAFTGCTQAEPSGPSTAQLSAEVFFAIDTPDGVKLASELREFNATEQTLANVVLAQLITGDLQPLDPDYVNLWAAPNALNTLTVENSEASLDLLPVSLNVGAGAEVAAINQLVWTLTAIEPSVTSVSFLVDGQPAESFAGHVDTLGNFERALEYEVLNAIQIESINEGDSVGNPVSVSGRACTFEANLRWTLTRDSVLVDQGSTLAAEACPVRSKWMVELGNLAAGEYRFLTEAFSPKDGSLLVEDDKSFTVE